MSETSLNTGEMLFQLRVWDYLAWALDDKRLDHVENLYYRGGRSVFRRSPIRTCRW